jgi:hypothetical protein
VRSWRGRRKLFRRRSISLLSVVERWCVRRFWGLGHTGEVGVGVCGRDVRGSVLGEIDVAFDDGQGGGVLFLVCIWHEVDLGGVCPEVTTKNGQEESTVL